MFERSIVRHGCVLHRCIFHRVSRGHQRAGLNHARERALATLPPSFFPDANKLKERWRPDKQAVASSNLTRFADAMATQHGLAPFVARDLTDYRRLHQWSVANPSAFWRGVWEHVSFVGHCPHGPVVDPPDAAWAAHGNPAAQWFPGAKVHVLSTMLMPAVG
jgi:hypothetical protein